MEKELRLKFYKPVIEDLWFKEQLLADKDTMAYNHNYGGTIDFSKDKWADWYNRWMTSNNKYYRYIQDGEGNFIGEVAYYYDEDKVFCSVIILASQRGKGYGTLALRMLCNIAKENNIKELYDDIAIDNPSINLFLKEGFIEVSRNTESILIKKEL